METFHRCQVLVVAVSLALAVLVSAPGAWADIPMCNAVYADPTIPTCSCICEGDSGSNSTSQFIGCGDGILGATSVPTPDQCPDMLQGRRVLSAGDALLASDPTPQSTDTRLAALLFAAENDATTPGLGTIDGDPSVSAYYAACQVNADPFPMQTRFARLFNKPYDMMVTLRPHNGEITADCHATSGSANNLLMEIRSEVAGAPSVPFPMLNSDPFWVQLAIGDFDYDGFDDILYMNAYSMQVWSAVDTADPTKSLVLRSGTGTKDPSGALRAPINEPAIGDFNGDGIKDVAWIGGDFPNGQGTLSVFFASICPGSVPNTICAGAQPFQIIVDPAAKLYSGATSTIVLDNASTTSTYCGAISIQGHRQLSGTLRPGAVALGNFENNGLSPRGEPIDELVVTYVSGTGQINEQGCETDVQYWSFSPPAYGDTWAVKRDGVTNILAAWPDLTEVVAGNEGDYSPTINLYAQAAHLDWYGSLEQAVIGVSGMNTGSDDDSKGTHYFPVTVAVTGSGTEAKMAMCAPSQPVKGDTNWPNLWGSAVGRFSTSTTVNPDNPGACADFADAAPGDCPYNPQIALLMGLNNGSPYRQAPFIYLWNVRQSQPDGDDASLKCANDPTVTGFLPVPFNNIAIENNTWQAVEWQGLRSGSQLHAGDAFGNSMQLGAPWLTRISQHTQPQLIIQAPPFLIDYVKPSAEDWLTPAIVNFTRPPLDNYKVQIAFDTTKSETASTQQTSSFTFSATETASEEVKVTPPDLTTIDEKDKLSATQFHESNSAEKLSTYALQKFGNRTEVAPDDQVWFTTTSLNVFHFPVLGKTVCPASLTCDANDPGTTGCTAAASGVELTCAAAGDGCECLSAGASASLCPTPQSGFERSCQEQEGHVCCSLLHQPPLTLSFSGPEEQHRTSSPGASLEWYQPKHEPGQLLSYPYSKDLLENRTPGSKQLGALDTFTTGTNNNTETISWTCGTSSDVSIGTTTRFSFENDYAVTAGTTNLAQSPEGAQVGFDFDFQASTSLSNLNTYTVGQTASSEIDLLLQGAGFFNTPQYGYNIEGVVLGAAQPEAVFDNPDLKVCPSSSNADCSTVDQVQADCTTTGPVTVAFAGSPPASSDDSGGEWWKSGVAPYYKNIDVALNNPSRWRSASAIDLDKHLQNLQCRGLSGVACYTANQPTGLTDLNEVWDTDFYHMKGLFVTTGGTGGPQQLTATIGDEIYLQLRVYNYSLMEMDTGTKVYARFYRQQIYADDKNFPTGYANGADGLTLKAVPIGPTGLGDPAPIPVISPYDGSATIPKFNTTTSPTNDNISLATTSYTATHDATRHDDCEYDNGVESCDNAHYVYWVTVWAEDAKGNVIAELLGHGLGTGFDPNTSYPFITDVPLEMTSFLINGNPATFTNNVGMYKQSFAIVPKDNTAGIAATAPRGRMLDRAALATEATRLFSPVVVSADVVSRGAPEVGPTVVFYDGDPENGGKAFDVELLPYIRAGGRHFVRATYHPETCGTHEIFLEVTGGPRGTGDTAALSLDVDMDFGAAVDFLVSETQGLTLDFPGKAGSAHKKNLLRELSRAKEAFEAGDTAEGTFRLNRFRDQLETLNHQGRIDPHKASILMAFAHQVTDCIAAL